MLTKSRVVFGSIVFVCFYGLASSQAKAATTADELMAGYLQGAQKKDKGLKAFSASVGKTFFMTKNTTKKGEEMSCATCHTDNPTKTGKTKAGKAIDPIAISANAKRFTDKAKVEKWFKRNCKDVYDRECTDKEKGDFVAYMKAAK